MERRVPGMTTLLCCGASYQAVQQLKNKGIFVLPKGYQLVTVFGEASGRFLGYAMESASHIIVAFRGTENLFDVMTDFDWIQIPYPFVPSAGLTHRGFTELYEQQIRRVLFSSLSRLASRKKLLVTGHSLGGAIATLAALDISFNSKFYQPSVFTFGSPKVGDAAFAALYNETITSSFQIVNINDVIPRFPPSNVNFTYIPVNKKVSIVFHNVNSLRNHTIRNYAAALALRYPLANGLIRKTSKNFLP